MLISVVFPVYKSKQYLNEIQRRISSLSIGHSFETIFVDDGCPLNSWEVIREIASHDKSVRGIRLSRNFGQHYAISAGIKAARGEVIFVMDCDLQEDPNDIPLLLKKLEGDNLDIVLTLRKKRAHGTMKNFQAKMFYLFMRALGVNNEFADRVGTFSCMRKPVAEIYNQYLDVHRHYLMILRNLGFRTGYVEIDHKKREGASSYSFSKLLKHSLNGIVFQSNRLLQISILIGGIFILISLFMSVRLLLHYFLKGSVPGYTSLMITLFMCTGVILFSLGVHGIYLGKIFDQVRGRPIYVINETLNMENER